MGARGRVWQRWAVAAVAGAAAACLLFAGLAALLRYDLHTNRTAAKARSAGRSGPKIVRADRLRFAMLAPQAPDPLAPKPKEQFREEPDAGQIVETARPEVQQRPDKAQYLSRYDSKVEVETKARDRDRSRQGLGKVKVDDPSAVQSPQSKQKTPTELAAKGQHKQKQTDAPQVAEAPAHDTGFGSQQKPQEDQRPGSMLLRGPENGLLLPSTSPGNVAHNLQALSGASGSNDFLPEVENEGQSNLLNTRRFRFSEYFERIKDSVDGEWKPGPVWRSRDPTGERYGVKDRLTIVHVTLDSEGTVQKLRVVKQSGLDFLDDEALRALNALHCFPNPPAGLKNKDGHIEFQFGFMFEIGTQRFRMRGWQ